MTAAEVMAPPARNMPRGRVQAEPEPDFNMQGGGPNSDFSDLDQYLTGSEGVLQQHRSEPGSFDYEGEDDAELQGGAWMNRGRGGDFQFPGYSGNWQGGAGYVGGNNAGKAKNGLTKRQKLQIEAGKKMIGSVMRGNTTKKYSPSLWQSYVKRFFQTHPNVLKGFPNTPEGKDGRREKFGKILKYLSAKFRTEVGVKYVTRLPMSAVGQGV